MVEIIRKAVVDTGPLFDVLTLNFVRRHGRQEVLGRTTMSPDPGVQDGYVRLFDSIRTILTTSHVVGELQGLESSRLRLRGPHLEDFWVASADFLTTRNFDERLIPLLHMYSQARLREVLSAAGPSDTGLIDLALQEGCPLLTNDERTLARRAWQLGVDCQLVRWLVGPPT